MIHTIPNQFKIAQFHQNGIELQVQDDSQLYKTSISFGKNYQQQYALGMSETYLFFGAINQSEISFVCFIPFIRDLNFIKIFANQKQTDIIGFKLVYQNQELQIFIKNKKTIKLWIQRLSKHLNQEGFHQQYKPVRKIGKGGFATVYQVKRICDNKRLAVKAFSKSSAFSSLASRLALQNQIQLLTSLSQQNLIDLIQVFQSQNSLYLVMQNYQGGDLVTLIRKNNAMFKQKEILGFMRDLFKGLDELDKRGIMHRDIKPENIMIRKNGFARELVIGDFGLASYTHLDKYLLEKCGTPGYVAPEIANFKPGDKLTSKCDIFSLGVIFYIFLCRSHLFNGASCEEVYRKNKSLDFDLSDPKYDTIDSYAMDLLKRMLVRDPQTRISASQALQHKYFQQKSNINDSPMTNFDSPKKVIMDKQYYSIKQILNYD